MSKISRWGFDWLWRVWYPVLTRWTADSAVVFLNYGYAGHEIGGGPALDEEDEADRACIQLYHRVVGAADVRGMRVLEVSSGHGGGASYVARYLGPARMTGVDRNGRAIELCRRRHQAVGLSFSRGDAMALAFEEGAFDGVVNVEASHCYPDVGRFFSEVRRVLRPGGHFLYADFRDVGEPLELLRKQVAESGMEVVSREDISSQVVRGMQMNHEKYSGLIERLAPRFLRKWAVKFAGVKGSAIYEGLEKGETVYFCYHMRKRGSEFTPSNKMQCLTEDTEKNS